jgi:hypothetical protein
MLHPQERRTVSVRLLSSRPVGLPRTLHLQLQVHDFDHTDELLLPCELISIYLL